MGIVFNNKVHRLLLGSQGIILTRSALKSYFALEIPERRRTSRHTEVITFVEEEDKIPLKNTKNLQSMHNCIHSSNTRQKSSFISTISNDIKPINYLETGLNSYNGRVVQMQNFSRVACLKIGKQKLCAFQSLYNFCFYTPFVDRVSAPLHTCESIAKVVLQCMFNQGTA